MLATADEPDQADARSLRVVLSLMGLHDHLKRSGQDGLAVSFLPSFLLFRKLTTLCNVSTLSEMPLRKEGGGGLFLLLWCTE